MGANKAPATGYEKVTHFFCYFVLMLHPNLIKYREAPSPELVQQVVAASGMKKAMFERTYGLYKDAIKQAINQKAKIPTRLWHLFYEYNKKGSKKGSKSARRFARLQKPEIAPDFAPIPEVKDPHLSSLIGKLK